MPLYDYKCLDCDNEFEDLRSINDRANSFCPKCTSRKVKILLSHTSKNQDWFRPGYNEGLDMYIESKDQLKKECLKQNVTSRALGDIRNYHHIHGGERGY